VKQAYEEKNGVGSWIADESRELGNLTHSILDRCCKGIIRKPLWLEELTKDAINVYSEVKLISHRRHFAGTADLIIEYDDFIVGFDYKTVVRKHDNLKLHNAKISAKKSKTAEQISAYLEAYCEMTECDKPRQAAMIVIDPLGENKTKLHIVRDSAYANAEARFNDKLEVMKELTLNGLLNFAS
jgi:hypothetical protein